MRASKGLFGAVAGIWLALCATPVFAEPPTAAQVRELMHLVNVDKMLTQMGVQVATMMSQQIPCVPVTYWQDFINADEANKVTELMIPIYQRHFTAEDVDGLLKFYRSPLGQKMINEMPETMTEAMQVGQQWGRQRGQQMFSELQKQGKLGADGRCPATATDPAAPLAGKADKPGK